MGADFPAAAAKLSRRNLALLEGQAGGGQLGSCITRLHSLHVTKIASSFLSRILHKTTFKNTFSVNKRRKTFWPLQCEETFLTAASAPPSPPSPDS
jgi:hypothetical protein